MNAEVLPVRVEPSVAARLRERRSEIGAVVVIAGVLLLLARPFVVASADARVALFAVAYGVLALSALAVPVPVGARRIAPTAALGVGVAAVVLAAVAAGRAVPTPWSAATLPLSLLAAVAEEALFRRLAYGQLERWGAAVAIVGSAVLFTLVHLPAYGTSALPVDAGAALLFGWQRWASGTWSVPAATHAFANLVAVLR
jgi:membrane protease YdiL (CAAX protease family)